MTPKKHLKKTKRARRPSPGIVDGFIIAATPGKFSHDFDLPTGTYAIGVFHDVWKQCLDTNFLGFPKNSTASVTTLLAVLVTKF